MLPGFYIVGWCSCAPSGRMLPRESRSPQVTLEILRARDFYVRLENKPVYQSRTLSEEEALLLIGICRCFRPSLLSY